MKEQSALAIPAEPLTVEGLRASIARARQDLMKTAAALKDDLTPVERVREAVRRHPYLTLSAAFAVGFVLAYRRK